MQREFTESIKEEELKGMKLKLGCAMMNEEESKMRKNSLLH